MIYLAGRRLRFSKEQMASVKEAVALAEELTSDYFKYSTSQWRRCRYDILTAEKLSEEEITDEAFAQILRYVAQPASSQLKSTHFDFYKICLQDHVILEALDRDKSIGLFPLILYVVTHELVHIVRFSLFLQSFEAYPSERKEEEMRVHKLTADIIGRIKHPGVQLIAKEYWDSRETEGIPLDLVGEGRTR